MINKCPNCKAELCQGCIDKAMLDDEIRHAYINYGDVNDWIKYVDDLIESDYEPTEEEWELVKDEHEDDKKSLCRTINWINRNRNDFIEWLNVRMKPTIVAVKFQDKLIPGTFKGREYNYYCTIPVTVGDIVNVPTIYGEGVAKITEINVPDGRIDEGIKPILKTITSFHEIPKGCDMNDN